MKKLCPLVVCLLLAACVNDVRFERPQPEDRPNESTIAKNIGGIYRSTADSSLLYVSEQQLIRYVDRKFVVSRTLLDSAYAIKGDTAFTDTENKMIIRVEGDSVHGRFRYLDTLFDISQGNIVRKFKGYYFLNKEVRPDDWRLFLMKYKKNEIRLITSWTEKEVATLREITHDKSDETGFKPSGKEMARFIMRLGSVDGERLVRIYQGDIRKEWSRLTSITEPPILKSSPPLD